MRTRRTLAATLLCLSLASAAAAEVKTREVDYAQGTTTLKGFVAWDDAAGGKRPGILVVHEWWGQNAHTRAQARRLAAAGYVAFALDMYGDGRSTTHPQDAEAFTNEVMKAPDVLNARFEAALAQLKADPHVDQTRLGAVGYCFGGAVALAMARGGSELKAVAVFHAAIPPPTPEPVKPGSVKTRMLVLAGGADPMVPLAQVKAFERTMKTVGADIQVVIYPVAQHGFTNPDAAAYKMEGLAYDAEADKQSFAAALRLFKTAFR